MVRRKGQSITELDSIYSDALSNGIIDNDDLNQLNDRIIDDLMIDGVWLDVYKRVQVNFNIDKFLSVGAAS